MLAIWEPILPTDLRPPTTGTLARLFDPRVRQFYDADHLIAARMRQDARPPQPVANCCTRNGHLWDLAAIYPPGAIWTDRMPVATFVDGPVVDVIEAFERALVDVK